MEYSITILSKILIGKSFNEEKITIQRTLIHKKITCGVSMKIGYMIEYVLYLTSRNENKFHGYLNIIKIIIVLIQRKT